MVSHLLFVTGPTIGHLKELLALAANLVHDNPDTVVTLPVLGDYGGIAEKQLAKHFTEDELALKENVRLINLGGEGTEGFALIGHLGQHFETFYSSVFAEKDIKCATGRVYPALPKPKVVLLDYFLYNLLCVVRKISHDVIPVLGWVTPGTAYTLYFHGPEKYGGRGDLSEKAAVLAEKNGTSFEETEAELYFTYSSQGQVVNLPGFPPVYDYQLVPRDDASLGRLSAFVTLLLKTSRSFLFECDGVVSTGNEALEPELIAAFRQWFKEDNKQFYSIGPVLAFDTPKRATVREKQELKLSSDGEKVLAFLDRILESHGEESVLYISFGSYFWPLQDNIWKILEVIMSLKIPFIISCKREIPSLTKSLLDSYERCVVTKWAPQESILKHKATGWFLTHCGINSITEAICHGVPMIAWSLHGDQPINSINISAVHDIAFELYEVRLGTGLRPLYGGMTPKGTPESIVQEFKDVWMKAQGEDGARKRWNVQRLREKYKALWEPDGPSFRDYKKLKENYGLNV